MIPKPGKTEDFVMTWMILDVIAIGVLILFYIFGRRRGFIAMALLLIGTLAALWTAQHFAQPAARWAYDNYAQQRLVEYVDEKLEDTANGDVGALAAVLEEIADEVDPLAGLNRLKDKADDLLEDIRQFAASQSGQGEVIPYPDGIDPDPTQQGQIEQMLDQGYSLSESLVEIILQPLVLSFLEMLAFLLIFIAVSAIIKLLIHASQIFNKLPLLGGVNRFFGGICGLLEGAVSIYIVGILLRLIAAAAGPDQFFTIDLLEETKVLSSIIFFLE